MDYIKYFEYEDWSNRLILPVLKDLDDPQHRAVQLFSHLLSSHSMWLSRVTGSEFTCSLFQHRTLDECALLMNDNLLGWRQYLNNKTAADLAKPIEFLAAWEEVPSRRKIRIDDALVHIINHSSYHRGQIAAQIKWQVQHLPLTTYIMYASESVD
jgi:uncharacterized damage-inducible protein DinB